MTRRRRRLIWITLASLAAFGLIAVTTVILTLRSAWFYEYLRARMVREIEKASGGRTEVGSFKFDWRTMTIEVKGFVLHGKERPGEPVFLRAESITVGLKIISALKRDVDIATGIVEKPEFHLIVYPDGTTNMPSPPVRGKGNFVEDVLRLKVRHYEIRHGVVEFKEERVPLDIRGDNLNAALDYDAAGALYKGHLSSRQLNIATRVILPLIGDFDADLTFDKNGIRFPKCVFAWPHSKVEMAGYLVDWQSPHGSFDVRSQVALSELGDVLRVPIEHRGDATFDGKVDVAFVPAFIYNIKGRVTGRGLAARLNGIEVTGIAMQGDAEVTPAGVDLPRVTVAALDGKFAGRASLPAFKRFRVEGDASGFALSQLSKFGTSRTLPWSGTVSGPVKLSGEFAPRGVANFLASGNMVVSQAPGAIPVEGIVDVTYDQRAGTIELGNSRISTPSSRVVVSGTLGRVLQVSARTTDLNDVLPALHFASDNAPTEIPVRLERGGAVNADVTVTGPLDNPTVSGKAAATNFSVREHTFDSTAFDFDLSQSSLAARNLTLQQAETRLTGSGTIALSNWRTVDSSAVTGSLKLLRADVKKLLAQAGSTLEVSGTAEAAIDVKGTYAAPRASIQLTVYQPAGFGEQLDSLRADLLYAGNSIQVVSGEARIGPSRIELTGDYTRSGTDWKDGRLRFTLSTNGVRLEQFQHAKAGGKALSGEMTLKASGVGNVRKGDFDIDSLESEASVRGLTVEGTRLGSASIIAKTAEHKLQLKVDGNLRNSRITGSGEWQLEGDYPGRGEMQFSPITFGTLQRVAEAVGEKRDLPFQGRLEGRVTITGPLKKADELRAEVILPKIEITPAPDQRARAGARSEDLVLRNTEPVSLIVTRRNVVINSARFTGKDTNIEASGKLTFDSKSPWDLNLKGGMNLTLLQLFNADLLAQGNAVIDATVTGALNDPQVNGRMELRGASLYLSDIPTGVDNANGVVNFDRNRANIEKLTAEVGGGRVALGGFIGFNAGLLLYRVQGSADQVRIRYPEGVSTTLNAQLDLTGSSANSLISGTVTIMRAGFTPKADLGGLLALSAKPVTVPAVPNEYLRNIQLDVRIESGPSLQFETSLTRDLQAEADLRLRGNVARPVLLGDISVNEGEVNVFGTKYTINRAEVRFQNPARIEPLFDVDLETKARGITVNISFTGSLSKLNLTYRSDPPLRTGEIIALIAVGRDPTTSPGLAGSQVTDASFLQAGGSAIGQALTAPVSSRLQRFFGVSRLKIDPLLTGVENIPQARLTLEQQVSRDVTLTYITNLTRTQEQIIRIEWNISKQWSAIAVREENGVFGIDFQYRKRFK